MKKEWFMTTNDCKTVVAQASLLQKPICQVTWSKQSFNAVVDYLKHHQKKRNGSGTKQEFLESKKKRKKTNKSTTKYGAPSFVPHSNVYQGN